MSLRRQCELLGLGRSSYYYEPVPESAANLALMQQIDQQYLTTPFYGSRRMTVWLQEQDQDINRKRVQRLMRLMGLEAIYQKPRTTIAGAGHKVYPYLLRGLKITRPNQVWATDITYVGLRHGFLYLTAIIDWYSRYVLAWRLSNSLDSTFCVEALDEALARRPAGNLQHRPGRAVHQRRLHGAVGSRRAWRSAWTARGGRSITCSRNACGER